MTHFPKFSEVVNSWRTTITCIDCGIDIGGDEQEVDGTIAVLFDRNDIVAHGVVDTEALGADTDNIDWLCVRCYK